MWWYMSVIPALRRLRQEDVEVEASLGYIVRLLSQKSKEREREMTSPSENEGRVVEKGD
jgi:hypothetical protein